MIGILLAKIKRFIRNPWPFVIMTLMSIAFSFILGGANPGSVTIPIYASDDSIRDSVVADMLNDSKALSFKWMSKEDVKEKVVNGKAELGVELQQDDFRILVGVDSPNVEMVNQLVTNAYMKKISMNKY